MAQVSEDHHFFVVQAMFEGRLVPFLGAGVNRAGKLEGVSFAIGKVLPTGDELTDYLAKAFRYPSTEPREIKRVSEYVAMATGRGPLYEKLRDVFDSDYPPTAVHRFLAGLPSKLAAVGSPVRHQLILTTNYDDVLERALEEADEPYDVVSYVAEGEHRGKMRHIPFHGEPRIIESPNQYTDLPFESSNEAKRATSPGLKRTIVLKVHGAIDRLEPDRDSYVITEDNYIDYLAQTAIADLLPPALITKLKHSNLLFLGYSITDWNLRVFLNRLWNEQTLRYKSWAVQLKTSDFDVKFWQTKEVEVLVTDLEVYVNALSEAVEALRT